MESMESSTVAKLVEYFNAASIAVLAFFVICGAVMIIRRKVLRVDASGGKAKRPQKAAAKGGYTLPSAFCIAALAAFALEATAFQIPTWLKLFAGPELEITGASANDPSVVLTSMDGVKAELLSQKDGQGVTVNGIVFKNLNLAVTSLFVEVETPGGETSEMAIEWTDEQGPHSLKKKLLKRWPHDNYSPLQTYGKVKELKLIFFANEAGGAMDVKQVALNKRIPFYFSGLRIAAASLLIFGLICFFKKEPRQRAAYWLFDYKFNPADRKQSAIHAVSAALLILFSYICINTSYPKSYFEYPVHQQYNKFLVDALKEGRTWLDYGTPENLLKAERPYDNAYRIANGYKFNADVMWDWTWYKGKFYCYFGVVPAAVLYLPYKVITGEYLSNNMGIFLFSAVIIILMALLWRFCVKKYMPKAGFAFYILSFLTLFFASGIFAQLRFNRIYSIVRTAGLMFALAGCLLLLKSTENEKVSRLKVFFGCLCFALIAGCRPNMIFVSLIVPFVLWKYRSWKLLPVVVIPYVMVAVPLCLYNYVRFESIFEFGVNYQLTSFDITTSKLLNPFGNIVKIFQNSVFYLFVPNKYTLYFPFVMGPVYGMVNFPIVFCLLYLFKNITDKRTDRIARLSLLLLVIAVIIVVVDSYLIGFSGGYTHDFAFLIILPSLFCGYYWCAAGDGVCGGAADAYKTKERQSVVLVLLAVSIFIGAFLFVSGGFDAAIQVHYDPVLYRYLEYSLGILRNV